MLAFGQYKPDYFYLNLDKYRLVEWKKQNNIPVNKSFYHVWKKRKKTIVYFVMDKDNDLEFLNKKLSSEKSNIILLPNISNKEGVNPEINLQDIPEKEKNVLNLIKQLAIPFVGYQNEDDQFIKKSLKLFTVDDILLYLFLSLYVFCLKVLKKDNKFFSQMIKDIMPSYEKYIEQQIGQKLEKFTYNGLFREYYGFYFNYGITSEKLIRRDKNSKYTIKQLAYLDTVENNKFILKILFQYINKYDYVSILSSSEDYFIQKNVMIEEFGQGSIYL